MTSSALQGYHTYSSAISKLQRLCWWLQANIFLIMALIAGAFVTVIGSLAEAGNDKIECWLRSGSILGYKFGNEELLRWVKTWAPHFGPELLVLAFAAILVEGALRRRERRQAIRFRTVQSLMYLLNYSLQRDLYFDGGSANHLMLEKSAIERRARRRRKSLWSDERKRLAEAEKTAIRFIDQALLFAEAVDGLNDALARLRIDLFGHNLSSNFWATLASLENTAGAVIRRIPQIAWAQTQTLRSDDVLDQDRVKQWKKSIDDFSDAQPDDQLKTKITNYFDDYLGLVAIRADLIGTFVSFRSAAISFRDRVWEASDPDE